VIAPAGADQQRDGRAREAAAAVSPRPGSQDHIPPNDASTPQTTGPFGRVNPEATRQSVLDRERPGLVLESASVECLRRPAAGVARRSSRIRLVTDGAVTPVLAASVKQAADGSVAAELAVTHPSGKRSVRRLTAPSCSEAVDALALVIAITLDPTSVSGGSGGDTESGSANAAEGLGQANQPNAKANEPVKRPSSVSGEEQADFRAPQSSGPDMETVFHWRAGALLRALLGPAPELMPGLALALGASWDRAGVWSPALRLSATHYWLHGVSEMDGDADFEVDSGSLDACPVRVGGELLAMRPCANLELGRLLARGTHTFAPQAHSRPFAVLGGSLWLETLLLTRLEAGLGLSAGKTLVMDDFAFSPTTFHRVSSLTVAGSLGVSLRFP
jgi:hypothetical protein